MASENESIWMHRALYREIGGELPQTSQMFKDFRQAIVGITERDRTDHAESAEDLLKVWEDRGGISLGKYDNLLKLLRETHLEKLRCMVEERSKQINDQLRIENALATSSAGRPPSPFNLDLPKDDLPKGDPSKDDPLINPAPEQWVNKLLGKRKRSESPPQHNLSRPQTPSASLDSSFSTPEPLESVSQLTRSPSTILSANVTPQRHRPSQFTPLHTTTTTPISVTMGTGTGSDKVHEISRPDVHLAGQPPGGSLFVQSVTRPSPEAPPFSTGMSLPPHQTHGDVRFSTGMSLPPHQTHGDVRFSTGMSLPPHQTHGDVWPDRPGVSHITPFLGSEYYCNYGIPPSYQTMYTNMTSSQAIPQPSLRPRLITTPTLNLAASLQASIPSQSGSVSRFPPTSLQLDSSRQIHSHYSSVPNTDDQLHEIQRELRNWYISTLSRLHPIPWCEWLEQDLDHMFTNLEMVPGLKEQISQRSNSDYGDIQKLSRVFNIDRSKRTVCLIEGPAGIGKSTLCRRFVHLWSKNNYSIDDHYFDIAFLLEARLLTGNLKKCISEQLFPKDFRLSEDSIYDCLCNPQKKCLLIIDGVDELTAEGKISVMELLNGDKLRDVHLLLTGRPEASRELVKYVNSHYKITGFSDENVKEYICKYFTSKQKNVKNKLLKRLAYDDDDDDGDGDGDFDLRRRLSVLHDNKNNLTTIMKNPFTTLLVCSLAADKAGDIPANLKDTIDEVLQACYRKYIKKNEASGITLLSQKELFWAAGLLAYNGTKQGIIAYPEETLATFCPNGFSDHLLKAGILSKDFTISRVHPESSCYFPHKSFQEFMCAKYLTTLNLGELKEKFSASFHSVIVHKNMLKFLLGMLQSKAKTKVVMECMLGGIPNKLYESPIDKWLGNLEHILDLLYELDTSEDLLELLVQVISNSDWAITGISLISNYKIRRQRDMSAKQKEDCVHKEFETRKSIRFCQKYIQKKLLPSVLVVWRLTSVTINSYSLISFLRENRNQTASFLGYLTSFHILNLSLRQPSRCDGRLIDSHLPRHRELFVIGPSSLRDTDLLDIPWSFLHCTSTKDANEILTKGIKMSVLTILLEPGNNSVEDITALIKSLTSTKYKVDVLFLLAEDLLDDQHVLRMLSMFSSLHNVSFIKIRFDVKVTRDWPGFEVTKKYGLDCSIIQRYYSKFCPY